jgi:gamma-glutamyl:cysteine ligase YbdK (ATP-grasp superfamily)
MGAPSVSTGFSTRDRRRFVARLECGVQALRELVRRPGFGDGPCTIGAELEVAILDRSGRALAENDAIIAAADDPRLQPELARFNVEVNLTPVAAAGRPFAALERELVETIARIDDAAAPLGGRAIAVGILPSLRAADLSPHALSDAPRYRALSAAIRDLRGERPFEIDIDGIEPVHVRWPDVTADGATTSFQLHLRVHPSELAAAHNAAQLATPIALAVSANSPIFLGHVLWDETRIALCEQATDDRPPQHGGWRRPSRVSFGNGWTRGDGIEPFAEGASQHPPLFPICGDEDALAIVRAGGVPALAEMRLHQGTVWRWNRLVYDPAGGGHLRIELRALPAGPTPADMAANAAFLLGLVSGLRTEIDDLLPSIPFGATEESFYRAARFGLDADILWPSARPPSPVAIRAAELALDCLPIAARGLARLGVADDEIAARLDVIRRRIEARITPAAWLRRMLGRFERRGASRDAALAALVEAYLAESRSGRPLHEWSGAS